MSTPQSIDRALLQSLGLSLASANIVMEEIERLRAELADMKAKHAAEVANGVELAGRLEKLGCTKAERDEFETQLMNAHKLVADGMKREAALREALVRLCNSWAEGTERENYEAMKEAKAAISSGRVDCSPTDRRR